MTTRSKCIHTEEMENEMERMEADRLDLEAAKLEQIKADKLRWNFTQGESSTACNCKKELEAERAQLEDEKTKLGYILAFIYLRGAQTQLEDAKLKLEEARIELENALNQLEASMAQTDINSMLLEAATASLEEAKRKFTSATKQLNNANNKLENAKTQTEANTAEAKGKYSRLEEENAKLQSEILTLKKIVNEMENNKRKVDNELKGKSELKNDKQNLENELNESNAKLKGVVSGNKKIKVENLIVKNPEVFFDISIRGVPTGRIVMELYADTTSRKAEIFRSLCTGEKGVSPEGRLLHFKGTSITLSLHNDYIGGGDIARGNKNEWDSIYGAIVPGECMIRKHTGPGDVTMYHGYDKVSFFIHTTLSSQFDAVSTFVLIGKVIQGMDVVYAITSAFLNCSSTIPLGTVLIEDSGQISP